MEPNSRSTSLNVRLYASYSTLIGTIFASWLSAILHAITVPIGWRWSCQTCKCLFARASLKPALFFRRRRSLGRSVRPLYHRWLCSKRGFVRGSVPHVRTCRGGPSVYHMLTEAAPDRCRTHRPGLPDVCGGGQGLPRSGFQMRHGLLASLVRLVLVAVGAMPRRMIPLRRIW